MIRFHTSRTDTSMGRRLVAMVNAMLPPGAVFTLDRMPQMVSTSSFDVLGREAITTRDVPGVGQLAVPPPSSPAPSPNWRTRFQNELVRALAGNGDIQLVAGSHDTFVGNYVRRELDLDDLAALPIESRAGAFIHELVEQAQRGPNLMSNIPHFGPAHNNAMAVESSVVGATRLQAEERTHPGGANIATAVPSHRWAWWVPYERPGHGVVALQLLLEGRNIVSSTTGTYRDIAAFRAAFQTYTAHTTIVSAERRNVRARRRSAVA